MTNVSNNVSKLESLYTAGGNAKMVQPLLKTVCSSVQILKIERLYDTSLTSGYSSERTEIRISKIS